MPAMVRVAHTAVSCFDVMFHLHMGVAEVPLYNGIMPASLESKGETIFQQKSVGRENQKACLNVSGKKDCMYCLRDAQIRRSVPGVEGLDK